MGYERAQWEVPGPRRRRPARRRPCLAKAFAWVAGLILLFGLGVGVGLFVFLNGLGGKAAAGFPLAAAPRPGERVNILVLGLDQDGTKIHRSDTMMVVSLDPLRHEMGVLSIPRDTLVDIPGGPRHDKITHAHAYGGPMKSLVVASDFLGVPIHYYVRVNFQGFRSLVDLLGGVTVDVEKPMHYVDPTQDLYINLSPGRQHLDGEKALEFVRYRNDSDLNRIRRQQEFLRAVADEAFRVGTITKLPRMAGELTRYIDTNMSPQEILRMAQIASAVERGRIVMDTVPTKAVWTARNEYRGEEADRQATGELADRLLKGIDRQANSRVRVRVVSGGGSPGAAERLVLALREQGYQVIDATENPGQRYQGAAVVYEGGDDALLQAQLLARTLAGSFDPVKVMRPAPLRGLLGSRLGHPGSLDGADLLVIAGGAGGRPDVAIK